LSSPEGFHMNIFEFRNKLIEDYVSYVKSFIHISDEKIRNHVEDELEKKQVLSPEPLIQLNPLFEDGASVDELVRHGVLHRDCAHIFRRDKKGDEPGLPLHLYKHQEDAIGEARKGHSYVLTTGTGSGKSLTYIIPIVDQILRAGTHGRGIQAIIVYPMNALVNSQAKALENYLPIGNSLVSFEQYTGQETKAEKASIIDNPPDILLTNYVMLELILTRRREQRLLEGCNLRFLVLDELHTYRGRQGADVALLVRRVRDRLAPEPKERLQCVGTSATLASDGPLEKQCENVAKMASNLFGTTIGAKQVIQETLTRTTSSAKEVDAWSASGDKVRLKLISPNADWYKQRLRTRIASGDYAPPQSYDDFLHDPLSTWIEDTYGVQEQEGRFIRTKPLSIHDGAKNLAAETGLSEGICRKAIQEWLVVGSHDISDPKTGKHPFAFRLHQFISKGDTIYASLEHGETRYLTLQKQTYVPRRAEETEEEYKRDRILLPLVFCRECGQEYYSVVDEGDCFVTHELNVQTRTEGRIGYLYPNVRDPWPGENTDPKERVPEDWLETKPGGETRVRRTVKAQQPTLVYVRPDGYKAEEETPGTLLCYFVPAPFRFCLHCDVSYNQRQKNDFAKLSTLSSEGRSTATTILSLAAIRLLNEANVGIDEARRMAAKMLSFTDNRQDASLQAGHFNDFVEIGLLRAGLYKAVTAAGQGGIRHEDLTMRIFHALNLPRRLYAIEPDVKYQAKEETDRAFRNVLGYRLYRDLKRGWRITSPNLEQCDLLSIDYLSLDEICEDKEIWQGCHETLSTASPETRKTVAKTLLDHMRRELAIKVDYLNLSMQESIQQQSNQRLVAPWALDENETRQEYAAILFPKKKEKEDHRGNLYLSGLSSFGAYIRRPSTFEEYTDKPKLSVDEAQEIIVQLLEGLREGGLVERVVDSREKGDPGGFQLPAATIIWKAGEGKQPPYDLIRVPRKPKVETHVNQFFLQFYQTNTQTLHEVEAREHTAQVPADQRKDREDKFRDGELPILYCSPTMELGIDIRDLNVVNMRNIPPTPANYAQRSGRAGRGGQAALVFSYCSTGSAHDQYFFRRPEQMVRGAVTPPRLDLANEDLIRAHIHAIWLAEIQLELPDSLKDLLDVTPDSPKMPLLPEVRAKIEKDEAKRKALDAARRIMGREGEDWHKAKWFTENWLDEVLNRVIENFDQTCNRWRTLYQAAQSQFDAQNDIIRDASRSAGDKQKAMRLRGEAESQLSLLTTEVEHLEQQQSDFYSYRYFATEGFLPGYNFPRLPLSAYIPARRTKQRERDAYLSRPRFLAISEFAPRAIVYHEGSRYIINRVILSVNEEGGGITTTTAKQCTQCGYLHPNSDVQSFDLCENCSSRNLTAIYQLFRLQNVATRRRDKINSDEEERMRQGYQIRTAIRFSEREGHLERYNAVALLEEDEEQRVVTLSYGSAATIWRINFGWWRNKDEQKSGFKLDFERGYWGKDDEEISDDQGDELSQRVKRVIPFVEDRRNCLLLELELTPRPDIESMASLQAALKNAIQVKYQLEDNELAAEPLPDDADRQRLLFYEASEGGAGVLRRLIDEPEALSEVALVALDLCHYTADGNDLLHAPGVTENCETACYYCLMTYANQRDHRLLDRKKVFTMLRMLAQTKVHLSTTERPRAQELLQLTQQSTLDIEQRWLQMLQEGGYRLPSATHKQLDFCNATPDFLYEEQQVVIYVDGGAEEYPERSARDSAESETLEDYGYMILRFGALADWAVIFSQNPYIFGRGT
jgi:superfamily II DNA/RNA helicase/very-short-patch-repair endonuclease